VKAHSAFKMYLALEGDRSCAKVAQALSKSRTLITRWRAAHDWQCRTIEFDRDLEQKEHTALTRERIEMQKRHRKLALLALKQIAAALPTLHPSQFLPGDTARMLDCFARLFCWLSRSCSRKWV
jgi:hypothetical protein